MNKIAVDLRTLILIHTAVEYGFKSCEKGMNLEAALVSVHKVYELKGREKKNGKKEKLVSHGEDTNRL